MLWDNWLWNLLQKINFGEVLQKQEKLQFLPSNLKFLGRPLDACRAQLKLIGFSMSNLAKLKIR